MYVVMRKFEEDKEWNMCGAFSNEAYAGAEVHKQEASGRQARSFFASHVWIAENGNHTWTA
jgi:hypothetical protein